MRGLLLNAWTSVCFPPTLPNMYPPSLRPWRYPQMYPSCNRRCLMRSFTHYVREALLSMDQLILKLTCNPLILLLNVEMRGTWQRASRFKARFVRRRRGIGKFPGLICLSNSIRSLSLMSLQSQTLHMQHLIKPWKQLLLIILVSNQNHFQFIRANQINKNRLGLWRLFLSVLWTKIHFISWPYALVKL